MKIFYTKMEPRFKGFSRGVIFGCSYGLSPNCRSSSKLCIRALSRSPSLEKWTNNNGFRTQAHTHACRHTHGRMHAHECARTHGRKGRRAHAHARLHGHTPARTPYVRTYGQTQACFCAPPTYTVGGGGGNRIGGLWVRQCLVLVLSVFWFRGEGAGGHGSPGFSSPGGRHPQPHPARSSLKHLVL